MKNYKIDAESISKVVNIWIEPGLRNKEKVFLDRVIKKIKEETPLVTFSLGELYAIFQKKKLKELKNEILKLSRKKIYFKLLDNHEMEIEGEFNLINSIYSEKDRIHLGIPFEILASKDTNSIYYRMDILAYIRFKEKFSFKFYPEILKNYDRKYFEYTVTGLKNLFGVKDSYYERFYDFEKNVLKGIIKDINLSSRYNVVYKKVKEGLGKTNKVISLQFSFVDEEKAIMENEKQLVLNLIKKRIKNKDNTMRVIEQSFKTMEYKDVLSIVRAINRYFPEDIDQYLELTLLSKYKMKNKKLKVFDMEKEVKSVKELEIIIYKFLLQYSFHFNYNFLQHLQNFRITKELNYEEKFWNIKSIYNKNGKSRVRIYLSLEK